MNQPPEESVKEFEKQLKTVVIPALEEVIQSPQETSVEILQARENPMKSIQSFLKKFNRISFRETPKNYPTFYDDDDEYTIQYREYLDNLSNAITPDLPTKEPDNSLSMGDEHLSTIPETKSDEVIKSSVEDLVLIPTFSDFNDDCTSTDDDYFEDIDYVEASPPDSKLVSLEEVKDDILPEKLLNITLFIAKIESLNDNPIPDCVLKSPSLFPIPPFRDHTGETSSGRTTHTDNFLPEYDLFLFEIEPDQGELTSVVIEAILGEPHVHVPDVLRTHPTLMLDSDFIPSDDSFGSDLEVSFPSGTRNKIFDPRYSLKSNPRDFYHGIHFLSHLSVIFFAQ
nr:hypothetical protein [Tanacetum cinerariifolium]GEX91367.1 hypothetical protein [Tanacetum cinerariifolium]